MTQRVPLLAVIGETIISVGVILGVEFACVHAWTASVRKLLLPR